MITVKIIKQQRKTVLLTRKCSFLPMYRYYVCLRISKNINDFEETKLKKSEHSSALLKLSLLLLTVVKPILLFLACSVNKVCTLSVIYYE